MMIWTFLVITYGAGEFEGYQSVIATPSQQACEDMSDLVMDQLLPITPDVMTQCVSSGIFSKVVRPKKRPW